MRREVKGMIKNFKGKLLKKIPSQNERLKSQNTNSLEFLENEITRLQLRLVKLLQEEYSLCARKEIILRDLEEYQSKIDSIQKNSSDSLKFSRRSK